MPSNPPFSETDLRAAVASAETWADALRFLGYEIKGANYRTVQRWVERWGISTEHFDPNAGRRRASRTRRISLEEVMVENSSYGRGKLKRRLLETGLKRPVCEMCGQGETWRGNRMALILDHINGVSNDHRLENLRIVCPNCAATLDTHCGRNTPRERTCPGCGNQFAPRSNTHRYCSQTCWGVVASSIYKGTSHLDQRKVERPPYDQLVDEIKATSFLAVGRKYGVSDNAVRKWLRWYEQACDPEPDTA
jgi:HNH endonuclease